MAYKAPKASSKFWLLYLLQRVIQRLARGVSRCALQKTLCPGIQAYHRHIKYVKVRVSNVCSVPTNTPSLGRPCHHALPCVIEGRARCVVKEAYL